MLRYVAVFECDQFHITIYANLSLKQLYGLFPCTELYNHCQNPTEFQISVS